MANFSGQRDLTPTGELPPCYCEDARPRTRTPMNQPSIASLGSHRVTIHHHIVKLQKHTIDWVYRLEDRLLDGEQELAIERTPTELLLLRPASHQLDDLVVEGLRC